MSDFDPTVLLAALTAGPIIAGFTFYGIKLHRDEVETGVEPWWLGRYIWATQIFIWPLLYLSLNYWFFWNLAMVLIGVFMSTMGTYLGCRALLPLLWGRQRRQHQGRRD